LDFFHYFLGIEVTQQVNGLLLNQEKYVVDLLAHIIMAKCTYAPTPLSINDKLSLIE
jgi:hypothetical protein